MDEGSAKVFVTVAAMKLLLQRLYAIVYSHSSATPDEVQEAHKVLVERLANAPLIKSGDPAISDVISDEVLREIEKILQGAEKDFRAMLK